MPVLQLSTKGRVSIQTFGVRITGVTDVFVCVCEMEPSPALNERVAGQRGEGLEFRLEVCPAVSISSFRCTGHLHRGIGDRSGPQGLARLLRMDRAPRADLLLRETIARDGPAKSHALLEICWSFRSVSVSGTGRPSAVSLFYRIGSVFPRIHLAQLHDVRGLEAVCGMGLTKAGDCRHHIQCTHPRERRSWSRGVGGPPQAHP